VLIGAVGAYEQRFGCGLPPSLARDPPAPIVLGRTVRSRLSGLHPLRRYSFGIEAETEVRILVRGEFDAYLELYRAGSDARIAADDDGGGGTDSALALSLAPGSYVVLVRGFQGSARGEFALLVARAGPGAPAGPERLLASRTGAVTSASGSAPIPAGAPCAVTVRSVQGEFNCRVLVRCGEVDIYGGGNAGYNTCSVAGADITAHDGNVTAADGDPRLDLDTRAGSVVVTETAWSVAIALQPQASPQPLLPGAP
jgi:hypothetical protein